MPDVASAKHALPPACPRVDRRHLRSAAPHASGSATDTPTSTPPAQTQTHAAKDAEKESIPATCHRPSTRLALCSSPLTAQPPPPPPPPPPPRSSLLSLASLRQPHPLLLLRRPALTRQRRATLGRSATRRGRAS
eukprot:2672645-Rhodomonas_salina.2